MWVFFYVKDIHSAEIPSYFLNHIGCYNVSMDKYFYYFFHKKLNATKLNIPKDVSLWPKSWTKTEYKNYLLLDNLELKEPAGTPLLSLLKKRVSQRENLKFNKINLEKISHILKCGYGEIKYEDGNVHRTSPSGGARYPLEIYIFLFNDAENVKSGIYHYDIKKHELEPVKYKNFKKEDIKLLNSYEFIQESNGIICITSIFDRSVRKYGDIGYKLILLEAGHVGQNICLAGAEKDIMFCSLGRSNDSLLEKEIGVNSFQESVVYTIAF